MSDTGVVIGCDKNREHFLAWWWDYYSRHNNYPVAIFDFGLSEKGRAWCEDQGTVLQIPTIEMREVLGEKRKLWEKMWGDKIWGFRHAWYKKALAISHSPFPFTCWLDLDCKVLGSIDPLFNHIGLGFDLALVREPYAFECPPEYPVYNGGVVVCRRDSPIIQEWAYAAREENHLHFSDQELLSWLIHEKRPPFLELPPIYNWLVQQGLNESALIQHYAGPAQIHILKELYPYLINQLNSI